MKSSHIQLSSSLGLLLTALIWGFAFVIVKNSLDLIPPIYMLAFRFTLASAVLMLILGSKLRQITKTTLKNGAVLGLFLFLAYAFQTVGCQYTTAGKNAFLTTIYVIIVPFLHWLINHKRPDLYAIIGAIAALLGIALLSLQGEGGASIGDLLTLICGFGFAIHMVYIDKYTEKQDPVLLTLLQLSFTALFSWILAPFFDGAFPIAALQPDILTGMLYLGLFSTLLGFLLQNVCQKYTAPSTASLLLSFESVFGVLFSVLLLNERLTPRMIIGCALMFFAILLVETHFSFLTRHIKRRIRP